jgi:hypothetical protein
MSIGEPKPLEVEGSSSRGCCNENEKLIQLCGFHAKEAFHEFERRRLGMGKVSDTGTFVRMAVLTCDGEIFVTLKLSFGIDMKIVL